ncbi:MAG: c-type cytochrome [Caldilineaceae bacterium]
METKSRDFIGLGLLMNLVLAVSVIVLIAKAFDGSQPTVRAVEPAPVAVAAPTNAAVAALAATATSTGVAPTATVAPTIPPPTPTAPPVTPTMADVVSDTGNTDSGVAPEASDAVVAIVTKGTCNACHTIPGVPGAVGIVGPNLANIGNDAANRIPGYSAEQYLHESIVEPNAFVAPQCPFGACVPGSMPTTLAQTLTPEEITTMVNYLLTLRSGQ